MQLVGDGHMFAMSANVLSFLLSPTLGLSLSDFSCPFSLSYPMLMTDCAATDEVEKRWAKVTSPSTLDPVAEQQEASSPLQCNWRPPSNAGLPPELACPLFAAFTELASSGPVSPDDLSAAVELCQAASPYYSLEVCLCGP